MEQIIFNLDRNIPEIVSIKSKSVQKLDILYED